MTSTPTIPPGIAPPTAHQTADAHPPAPARPQAPEARTFHAVLQKEWHELAPYLAVLAAALGAVLGIVLHAYQHDIQTNIYNNGQTAIPQAYFNLASGLIPLAAAILGFLAFFRETPSGRFAFLTHRPISRQTLFTMKFAADISLYLVATGLPVFVSLVWASDPRHIPRPFTWSMGLAPLADILLGIPCFAAGALVASRTDARWFGTRLLLLVVALLAGVLNYAAWTFAWSSLLAFTAAALLVPAACGAFASGGQVRSQSRPSKIFLAIGLYMSLVLAGGAALTITSALIDWMSPAPAAPVDSIYNTTTAFLKDGTPVTIEYAFSGSVRFEDSTGKTTSAARVESNLPILSMTTLGASSARYRPWEESYQNEFYYFGLGFGFGTGVHWYRATAGDYLVGFDTQGAMRIGAIGPRGFSLGATKPPETFKHPLLVLASARTVPFIASGDTLYDLSPTYDLTPVYVLPNHEIVRTAGSLLDTEPLIPNGQRVFTYPVLATADSVTILSSTYADQKPVVLARYQAPHLDRQTISAGYSQQTKQFVLLLTPTPAAPGFTSVPRTVIYLNRDGGVAKTVSLPPIAPQRITPVNPFRAYVGAMLNPPVIIGVNSVLDALRPAPDAPQPMPSVDPANTLSPAETFAARSAFLLTFPVLAAVATLLIARRFFFRRAATIAWTFSALVLGPAMIPLMFALGAVSRREKCPACGVPHPITDARCPRCGNAFPAPVQNGSEIFA